MWFVWRDWTRSIQVCPEISGFPLQLYPGDGIQTIHLTRSGGVWILRGTTCYWSWVGDSRSDLGMNDLIFDAQKMPQNKTPSTLQKKQQPGGPPIFSPKKTRSHGFGWCLFFFERENLFSNHLPEVPGAGTEAGNFGARGNEPRGVIFNWSLFRGFGRGGERGIQQKHRWLGGIYWCLGGGKPDFN